MYTPRTFKSTEDLNRQPKGQECTKASPINHGLLQINILSQEVPLPVNF